MRASAEILKIHAEPLTGHVKAQRLPFGSPGQLRAEDVRSAAESALKRKKNR